MKVVWIRKNAANRERETILNKQETTRVKVIQSEINKRKNEKKEWE